VSRQASERFEAKIGHRARAADRGAFMRGAGFGVTVTFRTEG
jgi:hypothetical protein